MNLRIAYVTLATVSFSCGLAFGQSLDSPTPAASAISTPTPSSAFPGSSPSANTETDAAPLTSTPPDPIKLSQYRTALDQANQFLAKEKFDDSLKAVEHAESLMGTNATTLNMRGAIMVKQKKFDEAANFYAQAIKLQPDFFPAEYNLGEIDFERGQYEKAADYFKKMLDDYPRNELLQFMVFLSYMQLNNTAEAEKWLNTIRFPSDSPSWYYAQAVWNIKNGNKGEARDLLRSSAYIFGEKNKFFDETLTQVELLPIK